MFILFPKEKIPLEELPRIKQEEPIKDSPSKARTDGDLQIEIAGPAQPFSQTAPTPSVITRMLQTAPGQTTKFPIGTIRPKQFATMPADDDDDDEPPPTRPSSQFLPGNGEYIRYIGISLY